MDEMRNDDTTLLIRLRPCPTIKHVPIPKLKLEARDQLSSSRRDHHLMCHHRRDVFFPAQRALLVFWYGRRD